MLAREHIDYMTIYLRRIPAVSGEILSCHAAHGVLECGVGPVEVSVVLSTESHTSGLVWCLEP